MPPSLILASASPRRTELLTQIGIQHRLMPVDIDESPQYQELPLHLVERLAKEKAREAYSRLSGERQQDSVVLAADTLIALDNLPLGKPTDKADCVRMLLSMSDREHEVLTAISLISTQRQVTQCVATRVRFGTVTEQDIHAYWETGEPQDKAGGYGIQGIGGQFVKSVNGSVSSVIGLPLYETKRLLKHFGVLL
ncbi:septum formation inhibitor Maf [Alteromonas aestuariivivens]|uniref:dTTP/UTP pyrophosphatase n=1 Tax=Alteromonas aestuariivivens TaxID=1938339 RepID=A0A3D8M763_9ALTE|nr:Maf family protein [Alteromonas aestuariivivens]RDV25558.1 septum formation inhibitor Maf [Alteromonas aestuariivivens]